MFMPVQKKRVKMAQALHVAIEGQLNPQCRGASNSSLAVCPRYGPVYPPPVYPRPHPYPGGGHHGGPYPPPVPHAAVYIEPEKIVLNCIVQGYSSTVRYEINTVPQTARPMDRYTYFSPIR